MFLHINNKKSKCVLGGVFFIKTSCLRNVKCQTLVQEFEGFFFAGVVVKTIW